MMHERMIAKVNESNPHSVQIYGCVSRITRSKILSAMALLVKSVLKIPSTYFIDSGKIFISSQGTENHLSDERNTQLLFHSQLFQ